MVPENITQFSDHTETISSLLATILKNNLAKSGIFRKGKCSNIIQWVPGAERPESEAHHSPPSNTEAKNACSYTSTHPYAFMVRYLFTPRENV
jgi:hypothetical protein